MKNEKTVIDKRQSSFSSPILLLSSSRKPQSDGFANSFFFFFRGRGKISTETHRSWLYTALNPRSNRPHALIFKSFMTFVIIADLIFFIVSTEPKYHNNIIFFQLEGVTSTIFLIEYLARLLTATESKSYRALGFIHGRWKYVMTYPALIDALATFPFFLEQFVPGCGSLPTLTHLRMFRLFRILKTRPFVVALDALYRVFYYNRQVLLVALNVCLFLIVKSAVLLYYFRPPDNTSNGFDSILGTLYISILLLTGQGGPDDSTNMPWYTKTIVMLISIFSVGVFAIPASMLTWGFEAEAARLAAKNRQTEKEKEKASARRKMLKRLSTKTAKYMIEGQIPEKLDDESLEWDSSVDSNSTDEAYKKIIAGDDGDEYDYSCAIDETSTERQNDNEEQQQQHIKDMFLEVFEKADFDHSGTLKPQEFVEYLTKHFYSASSSAIKKQKGISALGMSVAASTTTSNNVTKLPNDDNEYSNILESHRMDKLEEQVNFLHTKLDKLLSRMDT